MADKQFRLDLGVERLNVGSVIAGEESPETVDIFYNPTDAHLLSKIVSVFESLDEKQKEINEVKGRENVREMVDTLLKYDAEMREQIDSIFGKEVSRVLFQDYDAFCLSGGGLPLWAEFLFFLIDLMNDDANAGNEKLNYRIDKYTKKYHR